MSEWIEYTGSDEQIAEMKNTNNGFVFRYRFKNGVIEQSQIYFVLWDDMLRTETSNYITHYLICQPHPYANLIKIWADTGCPVWIKFSEKYDDIDFINCTVDAYLKSGTVFKTTFPNWNIPGAEYRLTPFED